MSNVFSKTLGQPVPQSEPARADQVQNNAGGFVFQVSDLTRLQRFLILGTEGGTYYSSEKKLTKDNVHFLGDLIARNEQLVIDTVREISTSGRAYRNSPAIFAVAALFRYGKVKPKSLVSDVCRTATHLFEFAEYVQLLGGWSRSTRTAVSEWYTEQSASSVAFQAVKYRQRNGWTHRDMLRLSHVKGLDPSVGAFILDKPTDQDDHEIVAGFKKAQAAKTWQDLKVVLEAYNLPWEAVPTEFHKEVDLWKTLFYKGHLRGQALLRNVTRLSKLGAWNDLVFANDYALALTDEEMISKTRLHPIQYLLALMVHKNGQLDRDDMWRSERKRNWERSSIISSALDKGFSQAFKYVEPANKRTMIGLDVSGSMSSPAMGIELSCAEVGAAMAMTIARTEPYHQIMGFAHEFRDLGITPSMSLDDVLNVTRRVGFGGTDCSLPMRYARQRNMAIDTFVVITDNETWYGRTHPFVELKDYRKATGIDARLIVVALASSPFSIADPSDAGMLDVVGADANLPKLIAEFSAGLL